MRCGERRGRTIASNFADAYAFVSFAREFLTTRAVISK